MLDSFYETKYEVKDILKVNRSGCKDINFFSTITVTNDEKEYFQAKVVRHLDQSLDFLIIRPRVMRISFLLFFKFHNLKELMTNFSAFANY